MTEPDTCPKCGTDYVGRTDLTRRTGLEIPVNDYRRMCVYPERVMRDSMVKDSLSDTARFTYWGYLHR